MYELERLNKTKEDLERLIREYKPINNFISTTQTPSKDFVEWRILNENALYTNGQFTIQNTKCLNPRGTEG